MYGIARSYGNVTAGAAYQSAAVEAELFESELLLEFELSELLDELSVLELELDSASEPELDSDFSPALPLSLVLALESFLSLKSVSYHPLPLSRKLGADSIFFKAASPHFRQSFRGSSENF
jgi:hypothetical protein